MVDYSFTSIEEQEAHFELTQDTFLRKERARYITQQSLSCSEHKGSTPKSCPNCGSESILKNEKHSHYGCLKCYHEWY